MNSFVSFQRCEGQLLLGQPLSISLLVIIAVTIQGEELAQISFRLGKSLRKVESLKQLQIPYRRS